MKTAWVMEDKLAVIGQQGKAGVVVVFDLQSKAAIDWFYCYSPQKLSARYLVYVEFYLAHRSVEPTDVVLIYDLAAGPAQNRLPGADPAMAAEDTAPVRVGIPVFPGWNAQRQSYDNRCSRLRLGDACSRTAWVFDEVELRLARAFDYRSVPRYTLRRPAAAKKACCRGKRRGSLGGSNAKPGPLG